MASRRTVKKKARRKNPVPPSKHAQVTAAIDLFKDFRGDDPEFIDTLKVHWPTVAFVVGYLDHVGYTTIRDGKTESYIHRFKKRSRPLLASSHDGKQLIILGGGYDFTERGIVDRPI